MTPLLKLTQKLDTFFQHPAAKILQDTYSLKDHLHPTTRITNAAHAHLTTLTLLLMNQDFDEATLCQAIDLAIIPHDLLPKLCPQIPHDDNLLTLQHNLLHPSIQVQNALNLATSIVQSLLLTTPDPTTKTIQTYLKPFTQSLNLYRAGWRRVIPNAQHPPPHHTETIADHAWGTTLLTRLLTPQISLPPYAIPIVHDLPEIITGDFTPHDDISTMHKNNLETLALETLLAPLPPPSAHLLSTAFQRYQANQTPQARLSHIADKIDMALQAKIYEKKYQLDLREFLDSAQKYLDRHPPIPHTK
ncbi:MAG: HD domain-containing protein [Proteobacteria bacterium]|nr:HD domain-containing protein [Pseudomonadota bacterium]